VPNGIIATSDATEAYQLVNDGVQYVERTLVLLKPDVLLILDRVTLSSAQPVQLRFQVFNDDGRGTASASNNSFGIGRPRATLAAVVHSTVGPVACAARQLDLPAVEGVFPYIESISAKATRHELLTVVTTTPTGESHGHLTALHQNGVWTVKGSHRRRPIAVTLSTSAAGVPVVSV
jgi:hypothetical protein